MRDAYGRTWVGFGKLFRAQRHRANRLFGVPLPLHSYIRSAHSGTAPPPLQSGAGVVVRMQPPLRTGTLGAQSYVLLPGDCAGVARKLLYKHALACCKSGAGVIVRMQPPLRTGTLGAQFCGRMDIFMLCSLCIVSCVCFLAVLYRDDEASRLE